MLHRLQNGFTLVELIIVIALISIVAGIGIPSLQSFMRDSRLSSASEELMISLMLAKTEATMQGKEISVTASGNDWLNGWTVAASGGTKLRVTQPLSGINGASGANQITFKPLIKAGTAAAVEFCSIGARKRTINVTATGSIKRTDGEQATSCP